MNLSFQMIKHLNPLISFNSSRMAMVDLTRLDYKHRKLIHFKFSEGFVTYFDSPYKLVLSNGQTSQYIDQFKMLDYLKGQVRSYGESK